jgi:hypothetical protein
MCPTDTTPDPRDMMRGPETPEFLEPQPVNRRKEHGAPGTPLATGERPPLPEHPRVMPADVEDEDADPVVETGPGVSDSVLNRG